MVLNPAGYVPIYDGGNPFIISGKAREAISGGQLVFSSGGTVSSGANSFDPSTDILFAAGASGTAFTGVALHNAGSNSTVSVALQGTFIVTCAGTVVAGEMVGVNGADAVVPSVTAGRVIGRALTAAGSEGYALIKLVN